MCKIIKLRDKTQCLLNAANFLESSQKLREQEVEITSKISTLENKINDITKAKADDLIDLGQAKKLLPSVIQKKGYFKEQLTSLKELVEGDEYKIELQEEIDIL